MEITPAQTPLIYEVKSLIEQSKQQLSVTVNASMSMLYWKIGKRINDEILLDQRAEYGKRIVITLSEELIQTYGNAFSEKNIRRMIQFSKSFPDEENVVSVIRQLS